MKMKEIKVSVIVPVYNVEPYLPRCLDSLIGQTLQDIEIICIDDCSTDKSLEILHDYMKKDPRVKVIELSQNSGVATARNAGIDAARGKYMGFVDSDDYVDLDFYEKLYLCAMTTGADIVKSNAKITEYNKTKRFDDMHITRIRNYGKWRFLYQWWTGLYNAKMIKDAKIHFPKDIISGQDIVFLTECVKNANSVIICQDTFYHYIRREDSLDEQILPPKKIESKAKAVRMICDMYNQADMPDSEYLICYNDRFNLLKTLFERNTKRECRELVARNMIDVYAACKKRPEFIDAHIRFDSRNAGYAKYLQSYDWAGLYEYLSSIKIAANDGPGTAAGSRETKVIWLLGAIPVLKIKKDSKYTAVKLFGVIDLFRLKHTPNETRLIVMYIPILRIKTK